MSPRMKRICTDQHIGSGNPALDNVNLNDPEDCAACMEHRDWPCPYHEGYVAGYRQARRDALRAMKEWT